MSNENINKKIRAQLTVSLITDTRRMFHFEWLWRPFFYVDDVYNVYNVYDVYFGTVYVQRWGDNPL